MEIKSVVKTPNGYVKFEGTLSEEETSYVMGLGLNILMQQGALKLDKEDEQEPSDGLYQ